MPLIDYGMQPYGPPCESTISEQNLVCTTEQLYDKATSEVQINGSMGKMVQNQIQSKAWMSFVAHPHQHFSTTDHV